MIYSTQYRTLVDCSPMASTDFPFLHIESCPDCDTELIAVVEVRPRFHPSLDPSTRVMLPTVEWLQTCEHID